MRERDTTRLEVARRAAELMYFDGVKEYLRAKRKAAAELGVTVFPNNAEIRDELDRIAETREGGARRDRLLALRRRALELMEHLEPFSPRLIGSVLSGQIKSTSDIDIHAFSDRYLDVGEWLTSAGYEVSYDVVQTRKGGEERDFPHFYVEFQEGMAEISVYPSADLKRPQRSSITHRTMDRATTGRLRRILEEMEAGEDE